MSYRGISSGSPEINEGIQRGKGIPRLTPSERRILTLVAEYMSCREIAHELALSEKTVENRRCDIVQKFQLRGHRGLVDFAVEWAAMQAETGSGRS
jgi:DNA-binding NarL/FixJ family response regulator